MLVVFIGQDLDKELITKTLDEVCLDDKEWALWEKASLRSLLRLPSTLLLYTLIAQSTKAAIENHISSIVQQSCIEPY